MLANPTQPSTANMFSRFARFFKAIPADKMDDISDVLDMWNEPDGEHKNPGRGEIVTGPVEEASGAGATRMTRTYSEPSPQQGLSRQYAEFSAMLDRHETALKAVMGLLGTMTKATESTTSAVLDPDSFIGRVTQKLAKARTAIRKAELSNEPDPAEQEARKGHLEAAADLLKSAKRLLKKAAEEMEDAGEDAEDDDEVDKARAVLKTLTKRLVKAASDEDEDETESDTKPPPELDASKKGQVRAMADHLSDIGVRQSSIADFLSAAAGGTGTRVPSGLRTPPDMNRSAIAKAVSVKDRVEAALASGDLDPEEEIKAQTLLQAHHLVAAGRITADKFKEQLNHYKSPASEKVRQLFA
jgi:hypothetical protein